MRKDIHMKYAAWNGFTASCRQHLPSKVLIIILAVIAGLITGSGAHLLKCLVAWVSGPMTDGLNPNNANYILLISPILGILLTGIFQRYILQREIFHGVDRLSKSLAHHRYHLPTDLTYSPILASSITLGFGGSAGSEGPIAYAGAAIGSNIGRLFGITPALTKVMIACGASAGIAGIFKAPVGGALFSIEVLCMGLSAVAVIAVFTSSVTAALTAYVWSGCTPDIRFESIAPMQWGWMPYVVVLGLFCGLYSAYYSHIMRFMTHWYSTMGNPWAKNIIAGSIIAVAVFLFPPLYGEGYGFIDKLLSGDGGDFTHFSLFASDGAQTMTPILMAAGILAVKAFATSSTNSGGGVAGDFAPTLFAGAVAGFLFAATFNTVFMSGLPIGIFVFLGMAAVMAGAIQAPLMAVFLTAEMASGGSVLLLPLALCAMMSYLTVRVLHIFFHHRFRWTRS